MAKRRNISKAFKKLGQKPNQRPPAPNAKSNKPITKPVNKKNYPTQPKNELGLKVNKPTRDYGRPEERFISRLEDRLDIVSKLDNNVSDDETSNIFDRVIDLTINVVDEYSVKVPDIRSIRYPKLVKGADFVGYDVDFQISFGSIHATYVKLFIGNSTDFIKVSPNDSRESPRKPNKKEIGKKLFDRSRGTSKQDDETSLGPRLKSKRPRGKSVVKLNVKDLIQRYNVELFDEGDKVKIPIRLIPVNESGREVVEGEVETIPIIFDKGDINIPRQLAINRLSEGFISQFSNCEFDESNYLTNLLHLGDGNNQVITTWLGSENSLILKLYEPLPVNISTNQKVWITKIQSKPIIDTLNIVGDGDHYCPPLQGPNFSLEVDNGLGYQIYDDLLASGSATNTSLIQKYITNTGIDTEKLNIQYATGSNFDFDNFVHFGSAEERIKNFWYKIELLESYQSKFIELTDTQVELGFVAAEGTGQDNYIIITEASKNLQLDGILTSAQTAVESTKQLNNINNLIGSFDGFENYLYTSTSDVGYPKNGASIRASTDSLSLAWYNSAVTDASLFDRNNVDYLNNNLPEFIKEDYQNEDFMLFMDMLGHHFDVIWVYINGLNNIRKPEHKSDLGFSNDLVYSLLESLGWEGKKAYDSQNLWEYALGQYKDGTQKYSRSLKDANEEIWRRILNNLPYLLKHKGTARSLKAVMACYGVPQSLLTIMEFGGPTDPTDGGTQPFTFEDRTSALKFEGSQDIILPWKETQLSGSLSTIEMNLKFNESQNHNLVKQTDGIYTYFELEAIQTTGSFGKIKFSVSSSAAVYSLETPEKKIFDGKYKTIAITRELTGGTSNLNLYLKESLDDRLIINEKISSNVNQTLQWGGSGGSNLVIGSASMLSLDEFRLWTDALDDNIITNHTKQPDSIAGNNYTASSEDMLVRFDFEYPKNRFVSPSILNVAISGEYGLPTASLNNFSNQSTYPYNHEVYERSVTAQVPSLGFNQADKIRFESQTLVTDLSYKVRATKKSLDTAPVDSSRLGLFFSPIKELNMDIIKSFGNFNIDNYIGAPEDDYKDEYTELTDVRNYYFKRLNRDIYEYIRLIRYVDKSLFDVLEDLVPARAKVSKGLLIEPHYLERSKTKWTKPTSELESGNVIGEYQSNVIVASIEEKKDVYLESETNQFQANIDGDTDTELSYQYDNYDANVDGDTDVNLVSTNPQYDSIIDVEDDTKLVGNYPTYVSDIVVPDGASLDAMVDTTTFEQIGMDESSLANAGFGLYAPMSGTSSYSNIDIKGNLYSSRKLIFKTTEQYIERISVQTKGYPATSNNEQVEYELQNVTKTRSRVTILPIGATPPSVGNDVTEVIPLNGYFPTHYRYKNNLSQGMQNSFFEGSKQTANTTPDGLSPVETITTNPNILRVADTGRGSGEPILEVD